MRFAEIKENQGLEAKKAKLEQLEKETFKTRQIRMPC